MLRSVLSRWASPAILLSPSASGSRSSTPASSLYSTQQPHSPPKVTAHPKEQLMEFDQVFPDLVRDLAFDDTYASLPEVNKHLSRCIQYTVPTGKKNRGMTVPISYKIIVPKSELTKENVRLANVLGWCVEFMEAYLLVADDIMDGSETRRGGPCWYRKDDLGLPAFNDAVLLENCIYNLLKKYFGDKPYYLDLVEEFHAVNRHTAMGQSLDLLTSKLRTEDGRVDVDSFDMKRYSAIVLHKTSYYSVYLPVALAMRMAGVSRPETFRQARHILLQIGRFFQIQDDYLDVFGDPLVTGKVGTDIQDGKCSWVIVVAMQRADRGQKEQLRRHYGRWDEDSVAAVRRVFDELKLKKIYRAYEEETYTDIVQQIEQIPGEGKLLPPKVFTAFLDRLYKRNH